MISNNVKSAFKVEKLHSIPRIREFSYVWWPWNTREKKKKGSWFRMALSGVFNEWSM